MFHRWVSENEREEMIDRLMAAGPDSPLSFVGDGAVDRLSPGRGRDLIVHGAGDRIGRSHGDEVLEI